MSHESDELVLYIDNDGKLYERMTKPVLANLVRKKRRGTYDSKLATKAFQNLADEGAKQYTKEHGSRGDAWFKLFPPSSRLEAAEEMKRTFENEYKAHGYKDVK